MAKASGISRPALIPNPKARLFDQVREVLRFHHYALRTEQAYLQSIRRFLVFHRDKAPSLPVPAPGGAQSPSARSIEPGSEQPHGWRHPRELGAREVCSFLTDLAVTGNVAASTQNQALNALVFLYEQVLQIPLGDLGEFARVNRPARLPVALTQAETQRVLAALKPG